MSTSVDINIDEDTLKFLISTYLERILGDITIEPNKIKILVKSDQNYKSEWDIASYHHPDI